MSVNQEFPVLDGIAPSWADIKVNVDIDDSPLIKMIDIASIDSGSSVEVGEQRGASGGRVLKRTTGSSKHEASMSLYMSGAAQFLDGLALVAQSRGNQKILSLVTFSLQLIWTPPNSNDIFERRIKGCRFMGDKLSAKEGNDAQTQDIALNPLEVVTMRNGVELVVL